MKSLLIMEDEREGEEEEDEEEEVPLRTLKASDSMPRSAIRKAKLTRIPSSPLGSPSNDLVSLEEEPEQTTSNQKRPSHVVLQLSELEGESGSNGMMTPSPILERITRTSMNVLSATAQHISKNAVTDSVSDAMSMLQSSLVKRRESGVFDDTAGAQMRLRQAKETTLRLQLQAFWQLLITGFEVTKFPSGARARKRVLWLALDGHLCLGKSKKDRTGCKMIHLSDLARVQKGVEAPQFAKSLSWRDARSKEQLCFSLHSQTSVKKVFALQVLKPHVRNVLVEQFEQLARRLKGDADGEFPVLAQKKLALVYATNGEILELSQVQELLLQDKQRGGGGTNYFNGRASDRMSLGSESSSRHLLHDSRDDEEEDEDEDDNTPRVTAKAVMEESDESVDGSEEGDGDDDEEVLLQRREILL